MKRLKMFIHTAIYTAYGRIINKKNPLRTSPFETSKIKNKKEL